MRIAYRLVLLGSIVSIATSTGLCQDDVDLIDDLPKETKEAAANKAQPQSPQTGGARGKRAVSGASPIKPVPGGEAKPPVPNTDLIDDVSPEQKQAARANAATKKAASLIPDSLADALAHALHANPNILVAEAKVQQAQAELNEVRQSVVHDLTVTFQRWSYNKDLAKMPEHLSAEQVRDAAIAAREDEAKLNYLIGVGTDARAAADASDSGHSAGRGGMHHWEWHRGAMTPGGMGPGGMGSGGMGPGGSGPMMGPMGMGGGATGPGGMGPGGMGPGSMPPMGQGMSMMGSGAHKRAPKGRAEEAADDLKQLSNLPEKFQRFLEKRVDMDSTEEPLKDVLEYVKEAANTEVDFVTDDTDEHMARPVTLRLKQVTIAAALQALVDLYSCAFVFRDYGILVIGPDRQPDQVMEVLDPYRAAGTPMIAPLPPVAPGVMGAMRMGNGGMPGMQAKPSEQSPAKE